MTLRFMGKKKGMTQFFDEKGDSIACSVIEAEPNAIIQVKQSKKEGWNTLQTGAMKVSPSKLRGVSKPLRGHFAKAQVEPRRHLVESVVQATSDHVVGQEIGVDFFSQVSHVDVTAVSKGKGFQGVIKRHGFSGGPAAHGSGFHRTAGSTGMRSTPGRCLPNRKMAGHMGNEQVTVQNLKVLKIDREKNVILVKGAIPGAQGSLVYVQQATKMTVSKR